MVTLNSMSEIQQKELSDLVRNSAWQLEGESENYVHTTNRVWRTSTGLSCEKLCVNEYGSAFGLNIYSFLPNAVLPDWLGFEKTGPDWIDLEP